jgi:hypothetical protein
MSQFNVTDLDFDTIKTNIKDHFKSQSKYRDWNFDGSGLSVFLDVLAYNTHYNAMLAHFSLNETFLDSAQIRGNVVSHAKLLGYIPRSTIASTATVDISILARNTSPDPSVFLPRGTRFTTIVDSVTYYFVNMVPLSAPLINNVYSFSNVVLKEGAIKRMIYRIDNSILDQKFEIPDLDVDTSILQVRVKSNVQSNEYRTYNKFTTFSNVDSNSLIYFVQENALGKYEIYFGDNVLGDKPATNEIVEIEYVMTNGAAANNASRFQIADLIGGYAPSSVSVVMSEENSSVVNANATQEFLSYGGTSKESIDSIKFNAPLSFISQNRAVTADDYRAIILREFPNVKSISVWGGEDNIIPNYGKVFISIKLEGADELFMNDSQKNQVTSVILKGKNVVSITPVIVDHEYTFLKLEAFFKFNPNLTDLTKIQLQAVVSNKIDDFDNDNLNKFDGIFRYSQLLKQIDSANPSILNSFVRVFMFKEITPVANTLNSVTLRFPNSIEGSLLSTSDTITSTKILIRNIEHYFGDSPTVNTDVTRREIFGDRTVYLYRIVSNRRVRIRDVGKIFLNEGQVILENFVPDDSTKIRIVVQPSSNDIAPKRNQLLKISDELLSVTGEIDTISVAGTSGSINYQTIPRNVSN